MKRWSPNLVIFLLFAAMFSLAFMRVHLGVQTTLVGYELGELKEEESTLLQARSQLQMDLAKLTTKRYLELMSQSDREPQRAVGGYAAHSF